MTTLKQAIYDAGRRVKTHVHVTAQGTIVSEFIIDDNTLFKFVFADGEFQQVTKIKENVKNCNNVEIHKFIRKDIGEYYGK